jgi:hypothetical protein
VDIDNIYSLFFNSNNNGYGDSNEGWGDGDGGHHYRELFYNQDCLSNGNNSNVIKRITRW